MIDSVTSSPRGGKGCTRSVLWGGACALVVMSAPAYAYVDPGSSGLILQALVGAITAGIVACRLYWRRIWNRLTGAGTTPAQAVADDVATQSDKPTVTSDRTN